MAIPGPEQLMVPLLRLLGSGPCTLHEAILKLGRFLPLTAAERYELDVDFIASPLNRRVAGAWNLLQRAALIESTGETRCWRLSSRGQALIETNPTALTISFLERYPEFLQARERTRREVRARRFRDLRLEFYAGGRRLMRENLYLGGPLLLSYAIEMALKAGFHTVEERWTTQHKKLIWKHDLVMLYVAARELGVFVDTAISLEFLAYAQDHFKRRCPSGEQTVGEERGGWSMGGYKLPTYDDCVCQLDGSLARRSGDPTESLVHAALHDVTARHLAEDVFDDNHFALRAARDLIDAAPNGLGSYVQEFARDPELKRRFRAAMAAEDERTHLELAALYRYPKHGENPQPDPDPMLGSGRSFHEDRFRWILKELRLAFGPRNVRVVELERPRGCVAVQVFDRGAKLFWRQILLGKPISDPLFALRTLDNSDNRRALQGWIEATKQIFAVRDESLVAADPSGA